MPVVIWISGPTGAGKTTLCKALRGIGFRVIAERVPPALVEEFGRDPRSKCAELQQAIMDARANQWHTARNDDRPVVFDRSVDEDISVFCRLHHENGLLTATELARLRKHATLLADELPTPDIVVALFPPKRTVQQRVTLATHPAAIVDTLARQRTLYTRWLRRQPAVIKLDNSACPPDRIVKIFGAL